MTITSRLQNLFTLGESLFEDTVTLPPVLNVTETVVSPTSVTLSWSAPLNTEAAGKYNFLPVTCHASVVTTPVIPASLASELVELQTMLTNAQALLTQIIQTYG